MRLAVSCAVALLGCAGARSEIGWRKAGGLELRCNPEDAEVYVDGTLRGNAKDYDGRKGRLTLGPGGHSVELRAPGYEPHRLEVMLGGARQRIEVNMQPRGAR